MEQHLQIDNHTLVEECRNGDKEALNLFYLRFAPRMLSVIRRYVSDVKDAEDILHDGFIVAFTRLGSLRDADKVDYWLATIMKNLSLQFLQSQDVAQMLHDIPEVEDTPQIDEIIDLATLETLIKKLPAGYQKVFRLAVLENKSHKEIAKLLGIAPNSSSSQLFHAKLMMRKLITDYKKQTGIWCLLLLCGGAGIMLWRNHSNVQSLPEILIAQSKQEQDNSSSKVSSSNNIMATQQGIASVMTASSVRTASLSESDKKDRPSGEDNGVIADNDYGTTDKQDATDIDKTATEAVDKNMSGVDNGSSLAENNKEEGWLEAETGTNVLVAEVADSIGSGRNPEIEEIPIGKEDEVYHVYLDNADPLLHRLSKRSSFSEWSLRVSADAGLYAFNTDASSLDDYSSSEIPGGCCQNPVNPGDGNNSDNTNNPDYTGGSNNSDNSGETRVLRRNAPAYKNYNSVAHTNYLPVSFSVAVNKALDNTFSVETGLTYTYLHTTFESLPSYSNCHWHYLGIPLKLNTKILNFSRVNMYMAIGGIVNIPIYSYADVTTTYGNPDLWGGRFRSSVVWSLCASYGISIKLSKRVDIFLEPTLQYHFEHNATVPNIWTDEKWGFSLPIGFRFNL